MRSETSSAVCRSIKKVDTLPKDKAIVFVCNSGGLAGEAYDIVKMLRDDLKIYFLEAEISHNKDGSYTLKAISGYLDSCCNKARVIPGLY